MYFMDAVRLLLRRWYVAVVGLVLIIGGAAYTANTVPTQYQASGEMLFLLPPDSTGARTPSNPYINLVPGLTTTAALIATEAMTKDVSTQFAADGFTTEYSVALVPSTGPLLTISTTDVDPAKAVAMRDRVMLWLKERLAARQKAVSVPESQSIYTEDTNVGKGAEIVPGDKIRALAGVGGAGMILTLLAAFAIDKLLSRRKSVAELKLAKVEDDEEEQPTPRKTGAKSTGNESATARNGRNAGNDRTSNGRGSSSGRTSNGRGTGDDRTGNGRGAGTKGSGPKGAAADYGGEARVKARQRS